jgi:hypothetical protein
MITRLLQSTDETIAARFKLSVFPGKVLRFVLFSNHIVQLRYSSWQEA